MLGIIREVGWIGRRRLREARLEGDETWDPWDEVETSMIAQSQWPVLDVRLYWNVLLVKFVR